MSAAFHTRKFVATAAVLLLVFCAGLASGWLLEEKTRKWDADRPMHETRLGGYDFINPLLECEEGAQTIGSKALYPFRHKMELFINENQKKYGVSHASVYFREMNNGLSIDIDGQEKFTPASLIKVPILITYLKAAESNPGIMEKKLTFTLDDNNNVQNIKPAEALEYGKSYSVQDLLFRMIAYSENNAYFLLLSAVDRNRLHHVYTDLGLEVPNVRNPSDFMSVIEYASFFRVLFNASYLNKDMSKKAMEYLTAVDYNKGLVGGLPPGTVVAHKFGEKTLGSNLEIKQLHDCGIVYYPRHPYLLCVMTRGDSFENLEETIREISHLVYEEVNKHYQEQ